MPSDTYYILPYNRQPVQKLNMVETELNSGSPMHPETLK